MKLTADTITDEQIRELLKEADGYYYSDGDPEFIKRVCNRALRTTDPRIFVTKEAQDKADADYVARRRPAARARCAEILNARSKEGA